MSLKYNYSDTKFNYAVNHHNHPHTRFSFHLNTYSSVSQLVHHTALQDGVAESGNKLFVPGNNYELQTMSTYQLY